MPRPRLTIRSYARRRWRAVGALIVLLLGALLVVAVADRGYDPIWKVHVGDIEDIALSPDGSAVYALLREEGSVTRLAAHNGETGLLLWEGRMNASRALVAASRSGVAVATDFPRARGGDFAFLTMYGADGSFTWTVPLEGNPIALATSGDGLALALVGPGNPVLVFDGNRLVHTHRLASPVRAIDYEDGLVAAGGQRGEVVVLKGRDEVLNVTLPISVRSLRMSQDGTSLVVGGFGLAPTDSQGHVAFLDIGPADPIRWVADTPVGVGLVDVDEFGLRALAVEEAPPTATVHVYEGSTGATKWTRLLPGSVSRSDSGVAGGAAMSPDGRFVAVATVRGDLQLLDSSDGDLSSTFRAGGAGAITFADEDPQRLLVAGRLLDNRPAFDSLLLFSTSGEPLSQRAPLLAGVILAVGALALSLLVGLGYWRARRPY